MVVCVSLEYRFKQTPDGAVWTPTTFAYAYWQRYLKVFDQVRIIARVGAVDKAAPEWQRVDGPGVAMGAVPDYHGPREFVLNAWSVQRAVRSAVHEGDAVIMRVSSTLASCLEPYLRAKHYPYAVEVVADPYDVFAPGAIRHPLRPLFRWYIPYTLRRQCSGAGAAAYVTRSALQKRYPCQSYAISLSDVELPDQAFTAQHRTFVKCDRPFVLIFVGLLDQLYKAPEVLIRAVGQCVAAGLDLHLVIVGDGQQRPFLEQQVRSYGLEHCVHFRGLIPSGSAIWIELDAADLFVLPSRQEGLPRAMLEAMARGLPCIGSHVGGIPELLASEDLLAPGDATALAAKIMEVVNDPARLQRMSQRNHQHAMLYRDTLLGEQRTAFYHYVRSMTEAKLQEAIKA